MSEKILLRDMQAKRTKENIIRAAILLASEKGLDGFTIREICKEADTSIGNFYHYFTSKDDVLLQTRQVYDERILSEIKEIRTDEITQLLLAIYKTRATFVLNRPMEESNVLYTLNLKNSSSKNNSNEYKVDAYILDIIKSAQENAKVTSFFSADEILSMINTIYHGCCYEYISKNGDYDLLKHISVLLSSVLSNQWIIPFPCNDISC